MNPKSNNLFSQIIEVFDFSIGYNGEFAIFEKKSLKIRNSKFQKSPTYFESIYGESIDVIHLTPVTFKGQFKVTQILKAYIS